MQLPACFVPVTIEINAKRSIPGATYPSGPQYIGSRFIISEEDLEQPTPGDSNQARAGIWWRHPDDPSLCRWYGNGDQPRTVHSPGRRIGTGTGILALVAAHLGAKEVVATDIDGVARQGAEHHVLENGSKPYSCRTGLDGKTSLRSGGRQFISS